MDLLSFILGLVSNVLGNVLGDFITGRARAVRISDIEKDVALRLSKQFRLPDSQLDEVVRRVMREIHIVSLRNPDLLVTDDLIELKRPITIPPSPVARDKFLNDELASRFKRLNQVIAERRQELGLITRPNLKPEPTAEGSSAGAAELPLPSGWELTTPEEAESKWTKAIRSTQDNIRRRREET